MATEFKATQAELQPLKAVYKQADVQPYNDLK